MEAITPNSLLRVTEVCERLSISRSSLYREIESGNLKAVRIGKSLRVSNLELDRYINALGDKSEVA